MLLAAVVSFILGGQSNAAGYGTPLPADRLPDAAPVVVLNYEDGIRDSKEPWLHRYGVSAGRTFARNVAASDPEITQVWMIVCPVGGTSISRWLPNAADGYLNRCVEMSRRAESFGAQPSGILWMQGEEDSTTPALANAYADRLRRVVAGFRSKLGKPVPFIATELPWNVPAGKIPFRNIVVGATRDVIAETESAAFVEAHDLTAMVPGSVHWERVSLRILGARMAQAWSLLR